MKKILYLLLLFCLILCFAACSSEPSAQQVKIGEIYAQVFPDRELRFSDVQSFSEGRSWVWLPDEKGYDTAYLIDTDGYVYLTVPFLEDVRDYHFRFSSFFRRGVSVISTIQRQALVDRNGKVLWDTLDDGREMGEKLFGAEADVMVSFSDSQFPMFSGYSIVHFYTEGNYRSALGILDPKGEWALYPSENITDCRSDADPYLSYIVWKEKDHLGIMHAVSTESGQQISGTEDELEETLKRWSREECFRQCEGLRYDEGRRYFENFDGEAVIDMSGYDVVSWQLVFRDGLCPFLYAEDDVTYAVVIDREGREVMQPFVYPEEYLTNKGDVFGSFTVTCCGQLRENLLLFTSTVNPAFPQHVSAKGHFYDTSGNAVTWERTPLSPFSEGLSWTMDDNGYYFINSRDEFISFR